MQMTKREEILSAASECFSTFGFSKTSMSDIGKRVGMNKASLYYHFKDKLSLYEEVINQLMTEHRFNMVKSIKDLESADDKIIKLVLLEIDFWSVIAIEHQYTGFSDEKGQTSSVVEAALDKNASIMEEVVKTGIANGCYRACNATEITKMIVQITQGLLLINCPLYLPKDKIQEGYDFAKVQIETAIRLIVQGLYKNDAR